MLFLLHTRYCICQINMNMARVMDSGIRVQICGEDFDKLDSCQL